MCESNHCLNPISDGGIILGSGVNDESVFQEGKSQESIGRSRSVFSTPTIPTGNQVTKSVNKPHYPKYFDHSRVDLNSALKRKNYGRYGINWIYFCDDCDSNCYRKNNIKLQKIMHCSKTLNNRGVEQNSE